MYQVLVLSASPLDRDPRVYKQILYLKKAGYYVISAGKKASNIEDEFYEIPYIKSFSIWENMNLLNLKLRITKKIFNGFKKIFKKIKNYEFFYWFDYSKIKTYLFVKKNIRNIDIIIANDIPMVPLALKLAGINDSKVIVDAHEYEPLHYNTEKFNSFYKDYWFYICKKYLPKADYMMTVCDGIADEYSRNFGIKCDVMMNLPFYVDLKPVERNDGKIKLIHHGVAQSGRKIENMIELMKYLEERFELDFILLKMDTEYGKKLLKLSENDKRIKFIDPVPMPEIPEKINEYDLGLFLLYPNTFNHKMVLPNKIFEYIQARLALAIWPSQEMVKIIDKYENGVYSENFNIKEMADILNNLTIKDIVRMKNNSHIAAKELNSDKNRIQLLKIVADLLKNKEKI